MNVLHLTCSLSRNAGGLFFSVRSLTRQLVALGVDAHVIAPFDDFTAADAEKWSPVKVASYPVIGPASLGYSPTIESMVGSPDIQHIHGIWMYQSRVNRKTAQAKAVPYMISPRGMLDPWAVRNSGWKKKLAGMLYEHGHLRNASCLHALCESEADSIRQFGLKNPICVIPNGIDLPIRAGEKSPNSRGRQKASLLFLGRIHPKKGLALLLRAMSAIPSVTRRNWELRIAGWDQNHQSELETLAEKLGLSSDVSFIGPQFGEEKHQLYRSCDAFILPSLSEGLPMSVLEAWSYGKPSIITTACNLPEGALTGAAIECAPDVNSLKEALLRLFSLGEKELQEMGSRGYDLVASKFAWPLVSRRMLDVYEWLLNRRDIPETVRLD